METVTTPLNINYPRAIWHGRLPSVEGECRLVLIRKGHAVIETKLEDCMGATKWVMGMVPQDKITEGYSRIIEEVFTALLTNHETTKAMNRDRHDAVAAAEELKRVVASLEKVVESQRAKIAELESDR